MEDYLSKVKCILEIDDSLRLTTREMQLSVFNRAISYYIEPEGFPWNHRFLSVFINQLNYYAPDRSNGFSKQRNSKNEEYIFIRLNSRNDSDLYIDIVISKSISVNVRKQFIADWIEENPKKSRIRKFCDLKLSNSSKALLTNTSLLYYSQLSFSYAFNSFAKSYARNIYAVYNKDNMQIYNYYAAFCDNAIYEHIDLKNLIETTQGFLKMLLSKHNNSKKKLDTMSIDSIKHYIMGGTYITPFASKLITSDIGSGVMLDTTWHLLQRYVVSVPTLIVANVGIPLGFTFALVEDTSIYRDFFETYQNTYGIKISDHIKIIESDQGKPLRSYIKSQGFQHLICLKHLLTSLGKT